MTNMSFHKLPKSIFNIKGNIEEKEDTHNMEHNFFEINNRLSHVEGNDNLEEVHKTLGNSNTDHNHNSAIIPVNESTNDIDDYYIDNPKNVPDSRNTVKKWFASNPEKQIQLINLFIDQLTWTNHLNFTEAIKMLRSNFDFPFVGARVLRRQHDFIVKSFENKVKKGLELNSFDMLVMRLRDKKRECDNNKSSASIKKIKKDEIKAGENNQMEYHMDGGLSNDKQSYGLSSNTSYDNKTSNRSSIGSAENSSDKKINLNTISQDENNEKSNSLRLSILNNIHQQIQTTMSDSNYSIYSDKYDQTKALQSKLYELENKMKELVETNQHYEKLLLEKDELLRTKDETIVKLVDNMIKLQEKL